MKCYLSGEEETSCRFSPDKSQQGNLLELDTKYIGVPEQKPDFETLGRELDIHSVL